MKKKQSSSSRKVIHCMISYVSLATKNIENGANANPQDKNEKGKIWDGN